MIKKLTAIAVVASLTVMGASAQILLHSFDTALNFYEGGNSFDGQGGVTYTDNANGTGTITGAFTASHSFFIATPQDWTSAANGLELTATDNSGIDYRIDIVNGTAVSQGFAIFTGASLTGGPVTSTFTVTGDLTTAQGFRVVLVGATPTDNMDITMDNLATVPEPSSMALIGLGAAGLYFLRRKK